MDKILDIKEKYDQIVLYRHVNPDLDAFGSQLGMYWTLKKLFPQKILYYMGIWIVI